MMSFFLAAATCDHSFFFLPSWWKYLPHQPTPPNCDITFNFPDDIWAVGLAILEMLLRVGGFLAVISIIVAGIQYIMASGEPEKGSSARKRLTNSLIGLAIILIAATFVSFVGNSLGG
jgi:hypothetical protein